MSVNLKGLVVGNLEEYCEFENGQQLGKQSVGK